MLTCDDAIAYLLQLCYLSGILTMFFCGIVMSHYTWHNVTESSRVTTKYVIIFPGLIGYLFFLEFQSANTVFLSFCCLLVLVGILLPHSHLFPRFSSSYMLVWMPWILRSGKLLAKGEILKLVFAIKNCNAIILLSPFLQVFLSSLLIGLLKDCLTV